jgi:hypothetical protein|tara:strand:- start:116 stop:475 length:360 start_codon:yes stop_codon:yes gene_type:complete
MKDSLKEIFEKNGIEKNLDNLIKYASLELETINSIDIPFNSIDIPFSLKQRPKSSHYGWNLSERKIVEKVLENSGLVVYFNSRINNSDGSGYNVPCAELTEKGRNIYSNSIFNYSKKIK